MALARSLPAVALLVASLGLEACSGCRNKDATVTDDSTAPTPEDPHDIGQYLSMAVMSDGSPAVSYYDRTKGALAFAIWNGEGWDEERIDGYTNESGLDVGDRGKYTSLVVDGSGAAWITYYDATNGNLFYAHRDAPNDWTTGTADVGGGATPNAGQFSSLALDAQDNPVVAHHDVNRGELRVAHWRDGSFSGESVDEGADVTPDTGGDTIPANVGKYAHLVIHDGTEYIAYYDAAAGDLKLATGTSGNYTIEVVDEAGDVGAWPSILIDGTDLLIAYQDVGNQDLKLARGSTTGGGWDFEVIDEGDFIGADTELFLNGSYPAILYFDGNENNLKLAQSTGSAWQIDTVAGDEAALGFHNETVSTNGKRYIGCYDYTNRTIWFTEL
ncbi:MAG: hypothetical protein H6739_38805 [Alphaproteobacteria bacterium]|nr:hypothetical protein [Alphaproteobacteria bacterium]